MSTRRGHGNRQILKLKVLQVCSRAVLVLHARGFSTALAYDLPGPSRAEPTKDLTS